MPQGGNPATKTVNTFSDLKMPVNNKMVEKNVLSF